MQQYYIKVPVADKPQALKIVEAHGLTIKMMYASRHYIRAKNWDTLATNMLQMSGVYILIGKAEETNTPRVYVGQSDHLGDRIRNHDTNKDFWNEILVFTNSQPFSITQIKTIEAHLYTIALKHNRCQLENSQQPRIPTSALNQDSLIRNDVKQILDLVHILGYNFFEPNRETPELNPSTAPNGNTPPTLSSSDTLFEFQGQVRNQFIKAQAIYQHNSMVVLQNSLCTADISPDCPDSIKRLRLDLEQRNVIVPSSSGREKVFAQDYSFDSASAASGVVTGRSSNGKTDWKTPSGMSLKEWISSTSN